MADDQNAVNKEDQGSSPAKRKSRGWWWKIPLALFILLVLLIVLLPTIASTGMVRGMILSQVNQSLPGKLAVGDWSLGWFSGTTAKDVTWTDVDGREVASVREIDTKVTLLQAIRQDMHLGEIVIRGVRADVVVPITEEAEKRVPEEKKPDVQEPVEIPDLVARLRIEDVAGQVRFVAPDGREAIVKIDKQTNLDVNFPGGGAASTVKALVALEQPSGTGTVDLNAEVNGLKSGPLDLNKLSGEGALALKQMDLDHLGAVLRAMGQDLAVKGILGGQATFAMPAPGQGSVKGEFAASNVAARVGEDELTTKSLRIPVDVELTGGASPRAIVKQLAAIVDQGQVTVTADVPLQAIEQLQNDQAVTEKGSAIVTVSVPDVPAVMNSLRNTLGVQEGVQITGGAIDAKVNIDIEPGGVRVVMPASLSGLAGVRGGQKIGPMEPVTIGAAARLPSLNAGPMDLADVSLKVNSSFMTLTAQGENARRANAQGNVDLVRLRDDFGALVDLSIIRSGRVTLNLLNQAADEDTMDTDLKVQVENLGLNLAAEEGAAPRVVEGASLLITGLSRYDAGKISFSQPLRVEMSGKLLEVPAGADGKPAQPRVLFDNFVQIIVDASADLNAQPQQASIAQLSVQAGRENPILRVMLEKPTQVTLAGKRGMTGELRFQADADLGRLQTIANRFAAEPAPGGIRRGTFKGSLFADIAADGAMKVGLDQGTTDFTYVSVNPDKTQQEYSDHVTLSASVAMPGDDSAAVVLADVVGQTVKLVLNASMGLNPGGQGAEMLRSVNVSKLDASYMDIGSLALLKPIVISDVPALMRAIEGAPLPEKTRVEGVLEVKSDVAKAMAMGQPTAQQGSVIEGQLALQTSIGMRGRDVLAELKGGIVNLQVIQNGQAVVKQPAVDLGGSVRLAPDSKTLEVSNFGVSSSTGLLQLTLSARVLDLGNRNRLEDGKLQFTPDWPQLWPLIYAMLPPEKQQSMGELRISGKPTNTIVFSGSFPAGQTTEQMMSGIVASGDLTLEQVNWVTYGINASGVIPFQMRDGLVKFVSGTAAAPTPAQPLNVNGGALDLSSAVIDMKTASPTLDIPANTLLAKKIGLNSVLVSSMGKMANPLFVDPNQAKGFVDVTIAYCEDLALSTEMYDPRHPGRAKAILDVYELEIGGKGIAKFMSIFHHDEAQAAADKITGEIKKGEVTIDNGRVEQKMTVVVSGQPIMIDGVMGLESMEYDRLMMGMPREFVAQLLEKNNVPNAAQYLPEQVGMQFTGPVSALRLDSSFLPKIINEVVRTQARQAVVGGLTGRGSTTQPGSSTQPQQQNIGGVIGDLLGGGRKREQAAPQQQTAPQQQPATQPAPQPTTPQPQQPRSREEAIGGLIGDVLGGGNRPPATQQAPKPADKPTEQPAEQQQPRGGLLEGLLRPR